MALKKAKFFPKLAGSSSISPRTKETMTSVGKRKVKTAHRLKEGRSTLSTGRSNVRSTGRGGRRRSRLG